jgi:ferric-dicitrate binding protein FerR (iron transport regulator)
MKIQITADFIYSYLSGKSTALQKQFLDEWVMTKENEEMFYKCIDEFEKQEPQYVANLGDGLLKFKSKLENYETITQSENIKLEIPSWRGKRVFIKAACVIFGLSLLYYSYVAIYATTTYASNSKSELKIKLNDGSDVILKPNSILEIPKIGFGKSTRRVFLKGEANFEVKHLESNQKFIVLTESDLEVVVLGTNFDVLSRAGMSTVELNRGKVILKYKEGLKEKELTMIPGQKVKMDNRLKIEHLSSTKKINITPISKVQRFDFDNTSLLELAVIIKKTYGLEVIFEDENLKKRTIEGSFQAETADELLEITSRVFELKISKTGDEIILSNK